MYKTFTKEDLLRYLYDEMNLEERKQLRSVIFDDNRLQADFFELKEAKECLKKFQLSPSTFALSKIMSYAKSLTVKPSKHLRMVDFVLN
tara:strand:- start:214 stop:480 length:267 start_codon:yes stop_codon:yes gene_type:complete